MENIPTHTMFCEKCGNRIPEGHGRCPICQVTEEEAVVQPDAFYAPTEKPQPNGYQPNDPQPNNNQPNVNQPNAYQQTGYQPNDYQHNGYQASSYQPNSYRPSSYRPNNYQPNSYQPSKPQRGKRKKKSNLTGLLLVGGIAAALVVVILIAVFSGVFASDETRLAKMEKNTANAISKTASQMYGGYLDAMEESLNSQEKGIGYEMEIKLSANELVLESLFSAMLYGEVNTLDMSWLENAVLNMDVDLKDQQMKAACGIGVNDKVLATIDCTVDGENEALYFGVPDLNDKYLKLDDQEIGMAMEAMLAAREATGELIKQMPSEKEIKKLLDKYLAVVFDYVEAVEKAEETVEVEGESKKLTVFEVKITAPKLLEMCVKLLEMAKEDETLKTLVLAFAEYSLSQTNSAGYSQTQSPEEIYRELIDEIDRELEDLEDERAYVDEGDYILLYNYIHLGNVIGRKAELYTDGQKEMDLGHYIFLPSGIGGVFEAVVEDVKLTGIVSTQKVEFALSVDGRNMLTVKAQNASFEDGAINGTFQLIPSKALLSEMTDGGLSAGIGSMDAYLELKLEGKTSEGTTAVSLVVGGQEMIGISIHAKETKYGEITVPKTAVSAQNENDLLAWVGGIQFDKLTDNMSKAGVPNEYVQIVNQLALILQMSGMLP